MRDSPARNDILNQYQVSSPELFSKKVTEAKHFRGGTRPQKMTATGGGNEPMRTGNEFETASRAEPNQFVVATRLASSASPSGTPKSGNSAEQSLSCQPSATAANQSSRQQQQQQWRDPVPLDSASSSASEPDNEHQLHLGHDADQQNQRPHVGPMGIFFKVWSLVKVTKSRHSRMKRQMGELNAGHQFRFMSGEQFGAPPPPAIERPLAPSRGNQQQQQRGLQRPTLLQDSHFKRAGSQPPPSSHLERRGGGLEAPRANQLNAGASSGTTTTCGTASSSSGLSSTTSSTLATNYATPNWAARIGRAVPSGLSQNSIKAQPSSGTSKAGNVERPRQPRSESDTGNLDELRKKAISMAKGSKPALLAAVGGQKSRVAFRRLRRRLHQRSVSDDTGDDELDEDADEEEEDGEAVEGGEGEQGRPKARPNQYDEELDSDQNDIYSTPNDSIQSVPNGQPMRGSESETSKLKMLDNKQTYKMTKSYSTNFFSSQTSITNGVDSPRARRGASDEPKRGTVSCRSPIFEAPSREADRTERTKVINTSASSRFFISSSSSEDSNPSQQSSIQCSIHVRPAMHYHGPARPSSLLLVDQASQSKLPSLLTPSTLLISGGGFKSDREFASQIERKAQQVSSPSCRLIGQTKEQIAVQYRKSPSLFDIEPQRAPDITQRFSSKYPRSSPMSSFVPKQPISRLGADRCQVPSKFSMSNSISLHDCKLASVKPRDRLLGWPAENVCEEGEQERSQERSASDYKLAQMLLELGSNPDAKDEFGCTALMHAIVSENLAAFKCLVERGVDLNETNNSGQCALDLICEKAVNEIRLEMLKLMIDNQVDLDRTHMKDNSRLLDRLIAQHKRPTNDKSLYIDSLLHNGAKLGSATWSAAQGKPEIQLKLLRKLCQDGYYLYKKSSIEAAVFRFEYALKRIDELEQQLLAACHQSKCYSSKCCDLLGHRQKLDPNERQLAVKESQQVKYQTFLGLSRCERKRSFFKRALEFANMSILIDSTSYEGYYSKAHILKDISERSEALSTIEQAERLVSKSLELTKRQLNELDVQEESLVFDTCFDMHEPNKLNWIESTRMELAGNLDYLTEAKRHIARMRSEIEASQ